MKAGPESDVSASQTEPPHHGMDKTAPKGPAFPTLSDVRLFQTNLMAFVSEGESAAHVLAMRRDGGRIAGLGTAEK